MLKGLIMIGLLLLILTCALVLHDLHTSFYALDLSERGYYEEEVSGKMGFVTVTAGFAFVVLTLLANTRERRF